VYGNARTAELLDVARSLEGAPSLAPLLRLIAR